MLVDPAASITHHQLRVFAAVAGEGSFARAARRLFMSEPTVSNHIQALERAIGAILIDRSRGRRTVELTPGGHVLLHTCQTMFQALEQGVDAVRAMEESAKRTIVIGAGPHFGGFVLPRLIETFHASRQNVTVRVEVGRNDALLAELKRGRLGLAVLFGPIDDDEVSTVPYTFAEMGLIAPPGHPLVGQPYVPLERLLDEPLVMAESLSPPRLVLENIAQERGHSLRIVMEAQDIYARIQAVVAGLGIAPMYLEAVANEIAAGRVARLNVEGFPQRLERFIVSAKSGMSPDARDFSEHLLKSRDEANQSIRLISAS